MTDTSRAPERIRRADAQRNRARVLAAARAALAEQGLDAPMPDIAARAGLGVGTVYRHFPTKEALVAAITEDWFLALCEVAADHAARPGNPWDNFTDQIWTSARMLVADRGLSEVMGVEPVKTGGAAVAVARLQEITGGLMDRAKASGAMRADAVITDVPTMMCGLGRIATIQSCGAPVNWERYLTLMLDGLRAHAAAPVLTASASRAELVPASKRQ